jgi:hypothetical protein
MASPERATAFDVKVVVTINEVEVFDEIDEPSGDADFFAVVTIDGVVKQTDPCAFEDAGDHIFPGWEFSENVDINAKDQVAVEIEIWDDDDPCPGSIDIGTNDEQMDIDPDAGRALNFTVDLSPCAVSGEAAGACNAVLTAAGDAGDDVGQVKFSVKVEEPPSAAGFRIQCTHTPLIPGPSGNVTINATSLDGALAQKVADTLEIYVTELTSLATPPPPSGTPALSASSNSLLTHTDGPFAVGFAYGCRAVDDGTPIWSGWKSVAPLPPMAGETIQAVGVTGPVASRLDVVFIGDQDNFAGPTVAALQTNVANVISGGYWGLDAFLANQDKMNFWLAGSLGDAEAFSSGSCPHVAPATWNLLYVFADAGAILHTDTFRDCATPNQGLFSTEPTPASFGTLRHETGHRPFGLADEYCDKRPGSASTVCDGGYFQAAPFPNLYETLLFCQADLANVGNSACQTFTSDSDGGTWFVSDPVSNDLMVDNTVPQNGDTRRMNWLFDQCSQGRC